MVYISEWLPNPVGSDAEGEWFELANNGSTHVSIAGWRIENSAGKTFRFLSGTLRSGEYRVFPRSATKLTLRNTDERLTLYDAAGSAVDESYFIGTAPEGKSIMQENNARMLGEPTPGIANKAANLVARVEAAYPIGTPLHPIASGENPWFLAVLTAAAITAIVALIIRNNVPLSNFLFGRNK